MENREKENIKKTLEYFKTVDLLLATILKTKGFQIKEWRIVYYHNHKRIEFYFENTKELRDEIKKYITTDYYPFKKFWQNLKELKSLLYWNE